jgi:hypothetical protein
VAELAGDHLDDIATCRPGHLLTGSAQVLPRPTGPRAYGMCGRLTVYPAADARTVTRGRLIREGVYPRDETRRDR